MYKATNDLSPPCIVVDLFKLNNSDYHQVENLILLYLCLTSVAFGKHSLHYLGRYNLGKIEQLH